MRIARLAVLCSGFGSNLQAILDAVKSSQLVAEIVCVISDNPQSHAIARARQSSIPAILLDTKQYSVQQQIDEVILHHLKEYQVDWVILAGFMRLLGPQLVAGYYNRILNIHPALLPAFRGLNAIERAWEAKVPFTGVTVHFVDEGMDTGQIILQEKVEIIPGESMESLKKRIHDVEHHLYPKAIQQAITGNFP